MPIRFKLFDSFNKSTLITNGLQYIPKKDPLELLLMGTRYFTTLFAIIITSILLGTQLNTKSDTIHVVRLDTSTIDMFSGLYSTLGNSISTDDRTEHFGEGLTTSQIIAITNYTSSVLEHTPDFIASTLYSSCAHYTHRWRKSADPNNPNIPTSVSPFDPDGYDFTNTTVVCRYSSLYDYREILQENSLEVLLSFSESLDSDASSEQALDDPKYSAFIESERSKLTPLPKLLTFIAIAEAVFFIMTLAYYTFKNRKSRNYIITTKILGHSCSCLSIVMFTITVFTVLRMRLTLETVKARIHTELSAFNVALHLGMTWFALMWILVVTAVVNVSAWVGPMWCSTPENSILLNNETESPFMEFSPNREMFDDSKRRSAYNVHLPSMSRNLLNQDYSIDLRDTNRGYNEV